MQIDKTLNVGESEYKINVIKSIGYSMAIYRSVVKLAILPKNRFYEGTALSEGNSRA